MNVNDLDTQKTAILFFDMLNGYYHEAEPEAKARMKPMVDNAVRLMKAGRAHNIPIFFARGNHRPDNATSALLVTDTNMRLEPWPDGNVIKNPMHVIGGKSSSEVIPELEPNDSDYYIPKFRWSAFYQTSLDLSLRARGINTLIISGGSTDVGVVSTVFSGRDMDYHMIVVRDACGSSHGREAHDMLMDLIFPRMARIRNTDQVVSMIESA
jgi:ureidoacrylate peracid hydrolase